MDVPAPPATPDRTSRLAAWAVFALGVAVAVASLGGRLGTDTFAWSTWSDRDLLRAAHLGERWPTSGAELSYGVGGRVPGPALYVLWALPLAVARDPRVVYAAQVVLEALGTLLVTRTALRRGGPLAAGVAVAALVTASTMAEAAGGLWNPGWVPLFAALGTVAALEVAWRQDAARLPIVALGFGIAAQLHLAALLPLGAALAAIALLRPRGLLRGLLAAAATLVALQAPYLVDEALHGWPNTRLLADVSQSDLVRGSLPPLSLRAVLLGFAPLALPTRADGSGAGPTALALATLPVGVAALGLGFTGALRRPASLLAALVGVTVAFFVLEGRVDLGGGTIGKERYLVAAAPAWALLVGLGADAGVRAATRRGGAPAGLAVVALLATGVIAQASGAHVLDLPRQRTATSWGTQGELLDDIAAATGWSLEAIAGRTFAARHRGGRYEALPEWPLTWRLDAAGLPPPHAAPPPCAVLLVEAEPGDRADVDTAVTVLGRRLPDLALQRVVDLPHGGRLLLLDTSDAACPTNTTQPYEPTDAERAVAGREATLDRAHPTVLPPPAAGVVRTAARLPCPGCSFPELDVVTDLDTRACPPTVTLVSGQLRGMTWNGGRLQSTVLDDATLVLREPGGVALAPLGISRLGTRGAETPVTLALVGAAGVHDIGLRGTTRPVVLDDVHEDAPPAVVEGTLVEGVTLPACP